MICQIPRDQTPRILQQVRESERERERGTYGENVVLVVGEEVSELGRDGGLDAVGQRGSTIHLEGSRPGPEEVHLRRHPNPRMRQGFALIDSY